MYSYTYIINFKQKQKKKFKGIRAFKNCLTKTYFIKFNRTQRPMRNYLQNCIGWRGQGELFKELLRSQQPMKKRLISFNKIF